MAGTITATTIQNDTSSPPTFRNNSVEIGRLCRAWVNYNGVAQTVTGSFNVSSVTYHSTGNFTVNFTTAMPNANYCVTTCTVSTGVSAPVLVVDATSAAPTTSAVRVAMGDSAGLKNQTRNYVAVHSS